jgi:hypothetical protein
VRAAPSRAPARPTSPVRAAEEEAAAALKPKVEFLRLLAAEVAREQERKRQEQL